MDKKYVTISLPVELHMTVKLEATRKGMSIIGYIEELVQKDLKRKERARRKQEKNKSCC